MAASCAIPGAFSPVEIDNVEYVDGGFHSPSNADVVADADLDLVVSIAPLSDRVVQEAFLDTGRQAATTPAAEALAPLVSGGR